MNKQGRKPYGTTRYEQGVIKMIRLKARKRKGGSTASLSAIARDLNSDNHKTKTGKLWTAQGVKNVLASNVMAGKQANITKTGLGTNDYLSKEQVQTLFMNDHKYSASDRTILVVLMGSGLRASELCALQVRDLGIFDGKSQIDVRRGKGSKQRCVFISQQLASVLRNLPQLRHRPAKDPVFTNTLGDPLTYDTLYWRIKKIGRLVGMPWLHPHTFRHTFGTLLYHYKKDLFFVMEQLGHSKVDTTQIYAKTLTDSKLEQMDSFGTDLESFMNITDVKVSDSKS